MLRAQAFATADYSTWGPFAVSAFFAFMFIGGCAGSTACSIKIFRYQVAFEGLRSYLFKMPRQHSCNTIKVWRENFTRSSIVLSYGLFLFIFCDLRICSHIAFYYWARPHNRMVGGWKLTGKCWPRPWKHVIGPSGSYQVLPNECQMGFDDSNDCRALGNCYGPCCFNSKFLAKLDFL